MARPTQSRNVPTSTGASQANTRTTSLDHNYDHNYDPKDTDNNYDPKDTEHGPALAGGDGGNDAAARVAAAETVHLPVRVRRVDHALLGPRRVERVRRPLPVPVPGGKETKSEIEKSKTKGCVTFLILVGSPHARRTRMRRTCGGPRGIGHWPPLSFVEHFFARTRPTARRTRPASTAGTAGTGCPRMRWCWATRSTRRRAPPRTAGTGCARTEPEQSQNRAPLLEITPAPPCKKVYDDDTGGVLLGGWQTCGCGGGGGPGGGGGAGVGGAGGNVVESSHPSRHISAYPLAAKNCFCQPEKRSTVSLRWRRRINQMVASVRWSAHCFAVAA